MFATVALAGGLGTHPSALAASPQQAGAAARTAGSKSLSRQFADWVVRLRYEDLPPAVVDRAKGLTLQNIASALVGSQMPAGQQAIDFVTEEEGGAKAPQSMPERWSFYFAIARLRALTTALIDASSMFVSMPAP